LAPTVLGEDAIEKGRTVVRALDDDGVKVAAAFWLRDAETQDFHLVLALPKVKHEGPEATDAAIREALERRNIDFRSCHIDVVSTTDETVTVLRSAVRTPPDTIEGIRLSHNVANKLIADAYVYRST
jgi:hypothetical protein